MRSDLRNTVASRYGIPKTYASHEEIAVDPDIEAVGVSAPYALQGRIAEDLLRAGKHVFMEKPMAVSLARADTILAAEKESGARLMVGYMKRYDPGNIVIHDQVKAWRTSGECGRILLARNHGFGGNWVYAQDPNIPFTHSTEAPPPAPGDFPEWLPEQWYHGYANYLQQWTHNINLLRYFLEEDDNPAKLAAVHLDQDGMTGLTVLDIGGVRAVVESGYAQFHAWEEHTQIYFEGGWVKTHAPALMHKESSASVEVYRAAHDGDLATETTRFAPVGWAFREEAKHFLKQIRNGEPFRSSAANTWHDVRLYEEVYSEFLGIDI